MVGVVRLAVSFSLLHHHHVIAHLGVQLEGDVLDAEGLENVLLEVVVQA